jgi:hypothetical protein
MRLAKVVSVQVAVLLVASAFALAGDIYVKSGSGGGGSKESPFGDLWQAVDSAKRGDIIHVSAGTYNGKGGCGNFTIKTPNLTVLGGYDQNFAARDPFKNLTILERAKDYKGDFTGLGDGIIEGKQGVDHSGLIVDGLVLNSASRNSYYADGKINAKDSWNGSLFKTNGKNIKIRNCILINPYGEAIASPWSGTDNEVSNNFIINTFYCAISTRSAQPDSVIKISNNTIAFCWFQPSKGGGMCLFVGNKGKTIIENNIFAFAQTEDGEAGFAVSNTFGNENTILKNNVFFQCQGGYYKYMDADKKNLLIWKPEELILLNGKSADFMLEKAEGNAETDPKLVPEKDYFEKFSNFVASKPGKLNMDFLNQWRRSVGLPLQAEPGSPRKNWGMQYPLGKVVPDLVSKLPGKGVQIAGPFEEYKSAAADTVKPGQPAAKVESNVEYGQVEFETFKKGAPESKAYSATPVSFKAGIGEKKNFFLLKDAPNSDYICVEIIKYGDSYPTRNCVYGYILKGTETDKEWEKLSKKKDKINKEGGVSIKGKATYIGNESYSYTTAVIIDEIIK